MKLLSAHIENFGKISNADFDFNQGITSYFEGNGYGKTTIATFLKSMFYGLDSDRSNIAFNERRHFLPFGGGNFGGNLTFEKDGKTFKIERFFDAKSAVKDTLKVYENGKEISFDGEVGQSIFGIDKASFERTVFISSSDITISATSNIKTKLNNLIAGVDDDSNLEKAMDYLDKQSKVFKKKSHNDLISEQYDKCNKMSREVFDLQTIEASLATNYQTFADKCEEVKTCAIELKKAQNASLVIKDWERYEGLLGEIDNTKNQIKAIKNLYPFGVPTKQECDDMENIVTKFGQLEAATSKSVFTKEDNEALVLLGDKFKNGVPSKSDLTQIADKIEKLSHASARLSMQEDEKDEKSALLKQRFSSHFPTEEEQEALDKKFGRYKELCGQTQENMASPIPAKKQNKLVYIVIAALACLLAVGGVAALFFNTIAGAVLLAVGGISLICDGFVYLERKSSQNSLPQTASPQSIEKQKIYSSIEAALTMYGYNFDNGIEYAVAQFFDDVQSFQNYQRRQSEKVQEQEKIQNECNENRQELDDYFQNFGLHGQNYMSMLSALGSDIEKYNALVLRKKNSEMGDQTLQKEKDECRKTIQNFCDKYKFDIESISDKLKSVRQNIVECERLCKFLKDKEDEAEKLKRDKNLTQKPSIENDSDNLQEKYASLIEEKNAIEKKIASDEACVERLKSLQNDYENSKAILQEYKKSYKILEKTKELLAKADQQLKDKYIKPTRDKFVEYSTLAMKAIGEKITMDTNFEVRYESNGKERSEEHLSTGQRSVCALCFRLALIENMYAEEKPFLIFDDPFANLDEEHMSKVKALLKELANKFQIIYFVCHPSRVIE